MKTKIFAAVATVAALAGCSTLNQVADVSPFSEQPFWDSDRDDRLSRAEYNEFGDRTYTQWDRNQDGYLDRTEFDNGWNSIGWNDGSEVYSYWDVNDDGYLDSNEYFADSSFGYYDDNDDGFLENDEGFF